jgi:hypothetical protein
VECEVQLKKCEYDGLDGCFTRLSLEIEEGERTYVGHILFENDGRDVETEGEIDELGHNDVMDLLWQEGNIGMVTAGVKQGYEAYVAL